MASQLVSLLLETASSTETADAGEKNGKRPEERAILSDVLLSSQEHKEFLKLLTGSPLHIIRTIPLSIDHDLERVHNDLVSLAFNNYKLLLFANSSLKMVQQDATDQLVALEKISSKIPALEHTSAEFFEAASSIINDRERLSLVLSKHEIINNLLRIPQYIETFIRNGSYEEAIDLQAFTMRLTIRHPDLKVIQLIAFQVKTSTVIMLTQLIQILRSNVKLPLSIRIIGYLRRMKVFNEPELRLVFLRARDTAITDLFSKLSETDALDYLKKYIEISRENLFDVITQYKAIFADSSTYTSESDPKAATAAILASYVGHAISQLVATLEDCVPAITDTTGIVSIMTQTMYYGMSLGRVGMDFRLLTAPIFESAIRRLCMIQLATTHMQFVQFASSGAVGDVAVKNVSGSVLFESTKSSTVNPPILLVGFPPIAQYYNGCLLMFNQLRVFAPLSLMDQLGKCLEDSLTEVVQAFRMMPDFNNAWERRWNDSEKAGYREAAFALVDLAVPNLLKGLYDNIYNQGSLSAVEEGSSVISVRANEAAKRICEPLKTWLAENAALIS
ncbi:hypothetical protein HK096_006359 [Nowakowskiella sp. JEL0078]|nr:hypothetical protein HK096_006359 [Nowakowskiella sp. JEL0078]